MGQLFKVKARFPNESFHEDVYIDMSSFRVDKEFPDETFGWYNGTYIAIKKDNI